MRSVVITIFLSTISTVAFGQSPEKSLHAYFVEVRAAKHPAVPQEIVNPTHAKIMLSELAMYRNDTLVEVRSKAYSLTKSIGSKSTQIEIRQQSVQYLVNACRDQDSGNVGSVLGYLTSFNKNDFSAGAKDSLRSIYNSSPPHLGKLIRLIGFLELNDFQPELRALAQQSNASKTDRWAAQLALARMGDAQMMQNILDRIKKLPVNDDLVYQVFPDLIYTRQLDAISYLTRVLFSDENNCETADAERPAKIPCAYRVMEQLAPVIKNYPLEVDTSGDIKTKDYVAALKKVREWFRRQKSYEIIRDTY